MTGPTGLDDAPPRLASVATGEHDLAVACDLAQPVDTRTYGVEAPRSKRAYLVYPDQHPTCITTVCYSQHVRKWYKTAALACIERDTAALRTRLATAPKRR